MRYSYEFKKECVRLYKRGRLPVTPDGVNRKNFCKMVRVWCKLAQLHGLGVLKCKRGRTRWSVDEKLAMVRRVLAGSSINRVAVECGIDRSQLSVWVRQYKQDGYDGLVGRKSYRKPGSVMNIPVSGKPQALHESEREELVRLRTENAYMRTQNAYMKAENAHIKAEIEVIKKRIALRKQHFAAQLKAKKQRSSENFTGKGMR